MELAAGMEIETNYGDRRYIITQIDSGCTCPEYHRQINGDDSPSEPHLHITCDDADNKDSHPFYLVGYRPDGTSVWHPNDRITITKHNNAQLALF